MESKILAEIGVDPAIILIVMFILIVVLFFMVINANMKYIRLKASYTSFMKGKDGKTLEESIFERFDELDEVTKMALKNRQEIRNLQEDLLGTLQKVGILRYDAFSEMGGNLSFALTLLDGNNNGYIINSIMHQGPNFNTRLHKSDMDIFSAIINKIDSTLYDFIPSVMIKYNPYF